MLLYLIMCRSAIDNGVARREGGVWVRSLDPDLATGLDLRKPDQARRLERALLTVEIE
jgi:hypothetical protein